MISCRLLFHIFFPERQSSNLIVRVSLCVRVCMRMCVCVPFLELGAKSLLRRVNMSIYS